MRAFEINDKSFFFPCYFCLVSSDNIARLWSLEQEEVVRKYQGHQKALVCLAFTDVVA